MAEKETRNKPKDIIEALPEEIALIKDSEIIADLTDKQLDKRDEIKEKREMSVGAWAPKTKLGQDVKSGKETDIDSILDNNKKILESEIVEKLLPIEHDLLLIGQAKGKFGGGKRRAWRQTQRKTMEGNVVTFSCMAVVGDRNGHVGIGFGKAKETLPSREKAIRNAKLNIIKVARGFETTEPSGSKPHTVPFLIEGKCGSVRIKLLPAPRGTGLVVGDECKKILKLAGIEDVYSATFGQTRTTFNVARACIDALTKTTKLLQWY